MQIAVIGTGNVGGALAKRLTLAGHAVTLLARDPSDAKSRAAATQAGASLGGIAAAAGFDVLILATPYEAAVGALTACGDIAGKIIIDATNPLAMGPDGLGLALGFDRSGGETLAAAFPAARFVKAFNTTGFNVMADPGRFSPKPVMFVAGDDDAARALASTLAGDVGFEVVDAGPLKAARLLEAHAMLWIDLALRRGMGRDAAFAVVRPAS